MSQGQACPGSLGCSALGRWLNPVSVSGPRREDAADVRLS